MKIIRITKTLKTDFYEEVKRGEVKQFSEKRRAY